MCTGWLAGATPIVPGWPKGRPAKAFREACAAKGVRVARDFPPFEKTHCRIAFGTMDEMQQAVTVFADVLGKPVKIAA